MKALEERIRKDGIILNGDVLKVGSFLNQQVDTALLKAMAEETKRLFPDGITKILTIESSGISFATAVAMEYGVPMVFAKKHKSANVSGEQLTARVYSFTHNEFNNISVSKEYILENDNILIADDFLANGNALKGLIEICEKGGAKVAGAVIEIEKAYQGGGTDLRAKGIRIESLAKIESMNENGIVFEG